MIINWVLADNFIVDPTINVDDLKRIGSFWGSWKTYRTGSTDNAICYDAIQSKSLIAGKFHDMCNFYVRQDAFGPADLPKNVRVFGGNFQHDVENTDEIIAIHLASASADIVLLYGFDWSEEALAKTSEHYRGLTLNALKSNPDTQYVFVDHTKDIHPKYAELDNVTKDVLANILAIPT